MAPEREQRLGLWLPQQQPQLRPEPRAGHRVEHALVDGLGGQPVGALVRLEAQPGGVAGQAQQPGGIVEERPVVQHAQAPRLEVLARPRQPDQLAVREVQGDRVDAEVAPLQVLADRRAELDLGEQAPAAVALAAGAREVEDRAIGKLDRGRPEPLVLDDTTAGAACHGHRVALDHEVELVWLAFQQQVAHGAADHVDGILALERGDGGRAAEAGRQIHGGILAAG